MKWLQVTIALVLICSSVRGQDDSLDSNDDNGESPVLLTLTQGSADKEKSSEAPPPLAILSLNDAENKDFSGGSNDLATEAPAKPASPFNIFRPFSIGAGGAGSTPASSSGRPSLVQAFLAGRGTAAAARPSPLADFVRNFNVTGRASKLRERIGRFRIPRLETNQDSFAYRAGRRIGLFFQNIGKRARALAERLRARAATATPTAT